MLKKRYGHFDDETLREAVRVFDQIEDESLSCLQNVCKTRNSTERLDELAQYRLYARVAERQTRRT